jgi:hypothetical protein
LNLTANGQEFHPASDLGLLETIPGNARRLRKSHPRNLLPVWVLDLLAEKFPTKRIRSMETLVLAEVPLDGRS